MALKSLCIMRLALYQSHSSPTDSADEPVVLIDGQQLAELMIEHNLGVTPKYVYEVKQLDSDYFSEE